MHVSIPVLATSHQPAEPGGDPSDDLSPSSWVSPPPPPVTPVALVARARELTKQGEGREDHEGRKDREDREELKGEVTRESVKTRSSASSNSRVLVHLEMSRDEFDGDETYCLLLRKLSAYKLTWVLVTALAVLLCGWVVVKQKPN